MELALIILGVLSAISSTGIGIANLVSQKNINNQNVQSVTDTNQMNVENQWKMWNATNEYNTPKAQMERFAAAGLNPNLIYGQSNTTNAANVGISNPAIRMPLDFSSLANVFPGMLNFLTQSNVVKKTNKEINKISIETSLMEIDEEIGEALKDVKIDIGKRELEKFESELSLIASQITNNDSNAALSTVRKLAEEMNYNYDKRLYDKNFPPDLDPNTKLIVETLCGILSSITNKPAEFWLNKIFSFNN